MRRISLVVILGMVLVWTGAALAGQPDWIWGEVRGEYAFTSTSDCVSSTLGFDKNFYAAGWQRRVDHVKFRAGRPGLPPRRDRNGDGYGIGRNLSSARRRIFEHILAKLHLHRWKRWHDHHRVRTL